MVDSVRQSINKALNLKAEYKRKTIIIPAEHKPIKESVLRPIIKEQITS